MKKLFYIVIALIGLCALISLVLYSPAYKNLHTVNISSNNTAPNINVNKGQLLSIELNSNPTTGYTWQLVENYNHTIITKKSNTYISNSNNIGGGGVEIFTLETHASGQTKLDFIYSRAWEAGTPPAQTKTFNVNIN